jgi:hypothetical protein
LDAAALWLGWMLLMCTQVVATTVPPADATPRTRRK